MNLTPQEQFVASILAVSSIKTINDLSTALQDINSAGPYSGNTPDKIVSLHKIIESLQKKKIIDNYWQVTDLDELEKVKLPIKIIMYLFHKFGTYENKLRKSKSIR